MSVAVKICGLGDEESLIAAVKGGARYVGFVFYPPSPRFVQGEWVSLLLSSLPEHVVSVGLFVDPSDDDIETILNVAPLKMIQLHGAEAPRRVHEIKQKTSLPLIKAVGLETPRDVERARVYEETADMLLLDAKPRAGGLPGGNAESFDWSLIRNLSLKKPWMLAGGLSVDNIAAAVSMTRAKILDVSSGVEDNPGVKNTVKIKAFLEKAAQIETCY